MNDQIDQKCLISTDFLVDLVEKMYSTSGKDQQLSFFENDILNQLDEAEPLLKLASIIPIDTTVQEKNITYPTDAKLAIKIIKRVNKLAKGHSIQQCRTYVKEVKNCRLALRHFRHVKKRGKAKKALTRLRTIAHKQIRELRRELPGYLSFYHYQKDFLFYERVLAQQPKDKNKIYSLHEQQVYCIGKGKDHKQYEYGNKVSIATTAKSNIIVGAVSHEKNIHDNHTLPEVLNHIEVSRGRSVNEAVCDRGYRGKT